MQYSIFGCRLNKYYLNQWLQYFAGHDFPDNSYLITTCEVTDRAKQKRMKLAKKKLAEGCHLYITGCGTLKRGEVISTECFYGLYPELRMSSDRITLLPESPTNDQGLMTDDQGENEFTKKFIVIQNGCDNHCSFCLTVQKRGKHSSRSSEEIVEEIKKSEENGCKEVVLTGVNIAAWGCSNSTKPEESQFASLLREILKQTTIPRIRLSSLGPEYLNDEFFEVIKDQRILPHFHLSIQSFSDGVLGRMRRNYSVGGLMRVLEKFRGVERDVPISLGADIIVGFPGETEEEFNETLQSIKDFEINKVHIFPFSDHHIGEKIPASALPDQVDQVTKRRREKELKKTADIFEQQFYDKNKGISHQVLVEGKGSGRTGNYIKVEMDPKYKKGEIIQIVL